MNQHNPGPHIEDPVHRDLKIMCNKHGIKAAHLFTRKNNGKFDIICKHTVGILSGKEEIKQA